MTLPKPDLVCYRQYKLQFVRLDFLAYFIDFCIARAVRLDISSKQFFIYWFNKMSLTHMSHMKLNKPNQDLDI